MDYSRQPGKFLKRDILYTDGYISTWHSKWNATWQDYLLIQSNKDLLIEEQRLAVVAKTKNELEL